MLRAEDVVTSIPTGSPHRGSPDYGPEHRARGNIIRGLSFIGTVLLAVGASSPLLLGLAALTYPATLVKYRYDAMDNYPERDYGIFGESRVHPMREASTDTHVLAAGLKVFDVVSSIFTGLNPFGL